MVGLQSGEGRMMIDTVVWAQYIHVTDTHRHKQPRCHSNSCPNALRSGGKNDIKICHREPEAGPRSFP